MKVLVVGSRDWDWPELIRDRLRRLSRGTHVLSGGSRGVDQQAATIARGLGFRVTEYPADWERLGRSAGVRRNLAMLDERPDLVLAFQLNGSTGTGHTIREARDRGIPVEVCAVTDL